MRIKAFTMSEIDSYGMLSVIEMALDHINPQRTAPIHVSFDIDSLDPLYAPSTGIYLCFEHIYKHTHTNTD
jgi:arginase